MMMNSIFTLVLIRDGTSFYRKKKWYKHIGSNTTGQHLTKSPYDFSFYNAIPQVKVDYIELFLLFLISLTDNPNPKLK